VQRLGNSRLSGSGEERQLLELGYLGWPGGCGAKASYTGMLKAFFDRYGNNGLAGVTAVPVMTGAWAETALPQLRRALPNTA